ncbi:hypothetical protein FACS1894130_13480 [Spirochaetia bacterium]|nr:hypothetical protein FACS1894130_13480 [Spirochaetia bacterium]
MSPVLNSAVRAVSVVLLFVTVYTFFFVTHRPPTRARRRALLILIGVFTFSVAIVMHRLVIDGKMSVELFYVIVIAGGVFFALLCGNLPRSMITVIYFNVISAYIDYLLLFQGAAFSGGGNWQYALSFALPTIIGGLLFVLMAVFYSRVSRKYPAKLTLRSWLLTALPPLINVCVLVYFWQVAQEFQKSGTNIYGIGLVAGIFLFLLNCFLFYWHITLLANSAEKTEWQRLMAEAQNAAAVPQSRADSNWSREAGLSEAFVAKYQFSEQERHALELAILGKADKEIAKEMDVSPSTVKTYMHRVYVKTDTYGRGGVFSLIHGGGERR